MNKTKEDDRSSNISDTPLPHPNSSNTTGHSSTTNWRDSVEESKFLKQLKAESNGFSDKSVKTDMLMKSDVSLPEESIQRTENEYSRNSDEDMPVKKDLIDKQLHSAAHDAIADQALEPTHNSQEKTTRSEKLKYLKLRLIKHEKRLYRLEEKINQIGKRIEIKKMQSRAERAANINVATEQSTMENNEQKKLEEKGHVNIKNKARGIPDGKQKEKEEELNVSLAGMPHEPVELPGRPATKEEDEEVVNNTATIRVRPCIKKVLVRRNLPFMTVPCICCLVLFQFIYIAYLWFYY